MSATDELRAELTKRGVEWKAPSSYDGSNRYDTVAGGYWFHEFDGKITIHGLTPAQAIAATLGSGTVEKAVERIEVLSGFAREYLHRYGMLMSMAGEDVTDEVLAVESVINEVCGRKVVDE